MLYLLTDLQADLWDQFDLDAIWDRELSCFIHEGAVLVTDTYDYEGDFVELH